MTVLSRSQTARLSAGKLAFGRTRDFEARGLARSSVQRLVQQGILINEGRGVFRARSHKVTEHHALAQVSLRAPHGVVCLLSALHFHGLTTQAPFEVWLAIGGKARKPHLDWPPLHVVRFTGVASTYGVEKHVIEGVDVNVTSLAKTVADCFKYRNKIGLDVALEALREYRRGRHSLDRLHEAALVCRVDRVMRPYLESLSA